MSNASQSHIQLSTWSDGKPVIDLATLPQYAPVTDWLICGPFAINYPRGLSRETQVGRADAVDIDPLGNERSVRPSEGDEQTNPAERDRTSVWTRLTGSVAYDFKQMFPSAQESTMYAATYLAAEEETALALFAGNIDVYQQGTVQVFLDGVEIGQGGTPIHVVVPEGRHVLLVKSSGGAHYSYAWPLAVSMGVYRPLGDDIVATMAHLPGYWRGDEDAPRVEIAATLLNPTSEAVTVTGMAATVEGQPQGPEYSGAPLQPGELRSVRLSAPTGDLEPGADVKLSVARGNDAIAIQTELPARPSFATVHVLEGFHCDPVWVSDQHQYQFISHDNVRMMMDACRADEKYHFFVHEVDYLKAFVDEYPEYRDEVFEYVRTGRISLGTAYSQPNENNISGEGIIRNILYGDGFQREFLGGTPTAYHAWDVFGHVSQLDQILAKSGHSAAIWHKSIEGFPPVFHHRSPDGSELLHIRTYYTWFSTSLDNIRRIIQPLVEEKRSLGMKRHLMIEGSDFRPPSSWMIGSAEDMADVWPRFEMTSTEEFIEKLRADNPPIPVTSRNFSQHHVGTFHTRVEMKLANRLGENLLLGAEAFSSFAALMGLPYPAETIDKAWRQLLFGQHHDAITGTPCDRSYLDLMVGYREAVELATEARDRALNFIAEAVEAPKSGSPVVVFNDMNWDRGGTISVEKPEGIVSPVLRDADGNDLPTEIQGDRIAALTDGVPGIGYARFTLHEAAQPVLAVDSAEPVVENEFWRIELDPARGGAVASFRDKQTGRELINSDVGLGNDLVALGNGPDPWEFHTTGEEVRGSDSPAKVTVTSSPLGMTATVNGRLGNLATFTQTLAVRHGRREVEARVEIDGYADFGHQFVVTTPVALAGAQPVFEDRMATIVARRGKTKHDYRTSGSRRMSECDIFSAYNWFAADSMARVACGSETQLNLGMMGFVTTHDSAVASALEPLHQAFLTAGVGCTHYFDDDDMPRKEALNVGQYGRLFYDHKTDDTTRPRLSDMAMCAQWLAVDVAGDNPYAAELLGRLPDAVAKYLADETAERGWSVAVAEDTEVPEGWPAQPVLILTARDASALAEAVKSFSAGLADGETIKLDASADFRSEPVAVDDYGFAVLTTGQGAASMEPDGTLTLFVDRTAKWAEVNMDRNIDPNRRRMVSRYGFLPYAGTWRDSGVVRIGHEFNHPLAAVAPTGTCGALPASDTFVTLDAPNAVITAVKPAREPIARFAEGTSNPGNGLIVRAYESTGRAGSGKLRFSRPVESAIATDLREHAGDAIAADEACVPLSIAPWSIDTLCVVPTAEAYPQVAVEEAKAEVPAPVWCRYWQHNVGAHPTGYLPVGIYIDGELPIANKGGQGPTVGNCRVSIVNNYTDRRITGTARVVAPSRWRVFPAEIEYDLAPREHLEREIVVALHTHPKTGLLRAVLNHNGRSYEDVLEVAYHTEYEIPGNATRGENMLVHKERPLRWDILRDGQNVVARIFNPWLEPVNAEVSLVAPMEMWGEGTGLEAGCVSPGIKYVTIPGRQEIALEFPVEYFTEQAPAWWGWLKVAYHGAHDYRPIPGTTA